MKSIPDCNRPGIYLIARFEEKPNELARPDVREILYIGVTTGKSQNIHKRLKKFFKSSLSGKGNHSGGKRFNRQMAGDLKNIYTAGFVPTFDDERFLNPFIFYVERKLIWEYIAKWGIIPECNGY